MDDDKKLTSLFADFNPEMMSDNLFMAQLEKRMQAVEVIKQYAEANRRKNKLAICVAACAGFVAGVVFTLCFPYLSEMLSKLAGEWSATAKFVEVYGNVAIWGVIATITIAVSYLAYDLTSSATGKHKLL